MLSSEDKIEKLARLRGVGDAYHDYRGELRYFSVETKREILRAMGCSVDDCTGRIARRVMSSAPPNWSPPLATSCGPRAGLGDQRHRRGILVRRWCGR